MPRKLLQRTDVFPYHVTARSNNRDEFPLPLSRLWRIVQDECLNLTWVYDAAIHSFVLMPNHFHMLITAPVFDLGKLMNIFMSNITRSANFDTGRSGHLFGGPYRWSLIHSSRYYGHAYKYVYRNPVKARLCETTETYPFSTLRGLIGEDQLKFPLPLTRSALENHLPITDWQAMLPWLNRPFPKEAEELINKGMKLKVFEKLKSETTRRPYEILDQFL